MILKSQFEEGFSQKQRKELYKANAIKSRFDGKDTIHIKRMLQHLLTEGIRQNFISFLFKSMSACP